MLELSEKDRPYNTIENARIIFEEDPLFSGHIRDNLFRGRIELSGTMPWSRSYLDVNKDSGLISVEGTQLEIPFESQ